MMKRILTVSLLTLVCIISYSNISLPAIFGDHMVLQQNSQVSIWGWGKPGEVIEIVADWAPDKRYTHNVENQSTWNIDISTPPAGGPYKLLIKGYNTIEINDILVGEVWLGSGQSNMEWTPAMQIDNAREEIASADFPEIRFFTVSTSTALYPQQHLHGQWVKCTPETMSNFSALMYFFGRDLHQNLKVPVGLINSSWGGTPIEVWMPEYHIRGDKILDKYSKLMKEVPWGPVEPGKAYNAMIHPLSPFKIRGVLWYQGEANVDYPVYYARALSTLIDSWRDLWGYDFPFYYAQIAPWAGYGSDHERGAILRDQQREALDITEGTGMAVLSDIGDLKNIHPGNKQDAGKRLAYWALRHDYGFEEMPFSGPMYQSYEIKNDRIIIHFKYAEGGLVCKSGKVKEFELLDQEGNWNPVPVQIEGETIKVMSGAGAMKGIRFAYHNDSNPDLYNSAGLPASCFQIIFKSQSIAE